MGYSVIKSFDRGIDLRRMIDTTEAGALLDGKDCHITRGGEIEKRAAFVVTAVMPAGTVGFYATRGPTFHTWGTGAEPAGMPPRGVYHDVQLPDDAATTAIDESTLTIDKILSVEEFSGNLYVVVLYSDGKVRHWYNDELVMKAAPPAIARRIPRIVPSPSPTFTPIPMPGPTPPTLPSPGRPQVSFYILTYPDTGTVSLNHISMASPGAVSPESPGQWVEPTGTNIRLMDNMTDWMDFGVIDSWFTYGYAVGYELFQHGAGAEHQIAALINAHVPTDPATPKAWAVVGSDFKITVWVEQQTTKYNGWKLHFFSLLVSGFVATQNAAGEYIELVFSGGVEAPYVPPDPTDPFVPGAELDIGTFVLAHNEKLYATQQQRLNFTALDNPTGWPPTVGSGFIDHTMMGEGMPILNSLADYGGDLAVFADRSIYIWRMDPLPEQNFKRQVLHRTGTIAPHSVVSFGQNEVMYLDRSGIRSLRQRESTDAAFASDFGNNIDDLVTAKIRNTTTDQHKYNFWGDVEPNSGRLWMALFDVIFVLSYYPGNRIAAWTYYDASAYPIDMLNANDEHIYWRSGDNIIAYGGESGVDYDATEALARVPYVDAGKPATFKSWNAIDAALLGTWQIRASFDPTQPTAFDLLANVTKSTYAQEKIAVNGKSPALSLEFRSTFNGPARIGNATLHYEENFSD